MTRGKRRNQSRKCLLVWACILLFVGVASAGHFHFGAFGDPVVASENTDHDSLPTCFTCSLRAGSSTILLSAASFFSVSETSLDRHLIEQRDILPQALWLVSSSPRSPPQ